MRGNIRGYSHARARQLVAGGPFKQDSGIQQTASLFPVTFPPLDLLCLAAHLLLLVYLLRVP